MSIPIYTYDAVIVGAGLAGCAAARELQKAGKKVAVVTNYIHFVLTLEQLRVESMQLLVIKIASSYTNLTQ